MLAGAELGAAGAADGVDVLLRGRGLGRHRGHPERHGRRAHPRRASLGDPVPQRRPACRGLPDLGRVHPRRGPRRDRHRHDRWPTPRASRPRPARARRSTDDGHATRTQDDATPHGRHGGGRRWRCPSRRQEGRRGRRTAGRRGRGAAAYEQAPPPAGRAGRGRLHGRAAAARGSCTSRASSRTTSSRPRRARSSGSRCAREAGPPRRPGLARQARGTSARSAGAGRAAGAGRGRRGRAPRRRRGAPGAALRQAMPGSPAAQAAAPIGRQRSWPTTRPRPSRG